VPDIEELRRRQEDDHNGVWEKFLYKHRDKGIVFDKKNKQAHRARKDRAAESE
jgi:hypothetical protein